MKRKLVFVATIHRNAERMFPAILRMADTHDIVVVCAGQVSANTDYEANRFTKILNKHTHLISEVYNSPPITSLGGLAHSKFRNQCIDIFKKKIEHKKTDIVVLDDSRDKVGLTELYRLCKKHGVPVVANSHGNEDKKRWNAVLTTGHNRFFDKLFVFGPKERDNLKEETKKDFFLLGGIPDNDCVKDLVRSNEYILVVVNFIMPAHKRDKWYLYDEKTLERMRLKELQEKIKKPVLFKLKHRFGHDLTPEITRLEKAIPEGLAYNIISEVENDFKLIEPAACVLSYGSTMCFKSIQAGIPTVIFEKLGDIGNFDDYYAKVKMGDDYFDFILNERKYEDQRVDFLERTVTGGVMNNASNLYASILYDVIEEGKK